MSVKLLYFGQGIDAQLRDSDLDEKERLQRYKEKTNERWSEIQSALPEAISKIQIAYRSSFGSMLYASINDVSSLRQIDTYLREHGYGFVITNDSSIELATDA